MLQSNLVIEKYWVTHSGYLRLVTTVELGMGITDGRILFCHGISEKSVEKKFQLESAKIGRFINASIITL